MRDGNELRIITIGVILILLGWILGIKTEKFLIEKGYRKVIKESDSTVRYANASDSTRYKTIAFESMPDTLFSKELTERNNELFK